MAYDRYDERRDREGSRQSEFGDRGGREDRGFFERAGDEIASWFGDDDEGGERGQRRERGPGRDAENGWGGDPDRGRGEARGPDRSRFERDEERRGPPPMNRSSGDRDFGSREGGYRPMTGDYGRVEEARGGYGRPQGPKGRDDYRTSSTGSNTPGREHDRHYGEWRQRQLDDLDRDYDEYHRERQQHFENDFGSWRQTRQQKRQTLSQAREQMDVVGSDGEKVGKVDKIAGDRVILTKNDSPDGRHHSIPCTMIDKIEGDQVTLDCTAEQAQKQWRDEDRERALFERENQGETGPHMLERSFSGTYRK